MDEKDFKKHLRDLAHGRHHPEEHDWAGNAPARAPAKPRRSARAAKKKRSR